MINLTLIALGRLKEAYLRDAVDEYKKRLSAFCKTNIIELTPEKLSDNPSQKEIDKALDIEAKAIVGKIPQDAFVVTMCIEGKQFSSEELSKKLEDAAISGKSNAVFIIGSSFGLSPEIKALADNKLSFSPMTFPHQLMRVMLLEQIYRAFQINNNGKYHKYMIEENEIL